jgi:hypothetical protein
MRDVGQTRGEANARAYIRLMWESSTARFDWSGQVEKEDGKHDATELRTKINTGQTVLPRDLLGTQMLLHLPPHPSHSSRRTKMGVENGTLTVNG